jgi:hypothetical protein
MRPRTAPTAVLAVYSIQRLVTPQVDVHRVHSRFTVIEPDLRASGAFILACEGAANTGRLSRLIEIEGIEECIPLIPPIIDPSSRQLSFQAGSSGS